MDTLFKAVYPWRVATSAHPFPSSPTRQITLKGTDREIGRQHAEMLGPVIRQGMPVFYHAFFERLLNPPDLPLVDRVGFQALAFGIRRVLLPRFIRRIPDFLVERVLGTAEAGGLSSEELLTAVVLPDLLPLLQAYLVRAKPELRLSVRIPSFGCSSFIAKGDRFLHGRNLDFPGVAYWDRYPVIQTTYRQGKIPFVALTSAGVPVGGITGVNAERISISLHQHYSVHTGMSGELPFAIGERVLSEARSLSDAMKILEESKTAGAWAFVVTDGRAKDGFILERHSKGYGVRKLSDGKGVLSHSNFFQTDSCLGGEYATTTRMNWDNACRKGRLEENVRKSLPLLKPENAVQWMSEHFDPYWNEEKVINRTVSQVYNIQSVVLDPVDLKLWMAEGDCPIQIRGYREYDLAAAFSDKSSDTGRVLAPYVFQDPQKRLAKESYILSFVAAFDGKFEEALAKLETCLEQSFFAEGALVAALICLKLGGEASKSLEWLEKGRVWIEDKKKALQKPGFPPEYFEILLYQARCLDLLGQRDKAEKLYHEVAHHPDLLDDNIRALAKKAKRYHRARVQRLVMPYSAYIPFE